MCSGMAAEIARPQRRQPCRAAPNRYSGNFAGPGHPRHPKRPQERAEEAHRRSVRQSVTNTEREKPSRGSHVRSAVPRDRRGTDRASRTRSRRCRRIVDHHRRADHGAKQRVLEQQRGADADQQRERHAVERARCEIRARSCARCCELVSWFVASARTDTASVCVPALPPMPGDDRHQHGERDQLRDRALERSR